MKCRTDDAGNFDFVQGRQRLVSFLGNFSTLLIAAQTEAIYLKKNPASVSINVLSYKKL